MAETYGFPIQWRKEASGQSESGKRITGDWESRLMVIWDGVERIWPWPGSAPTGKRMKVKVHGFRFGHFARSKIGSKSIFLINFYIITFQNKKIWAFQPIFNKVKKLISYCIFKSCAEEFEFFFFKLESYFLPNGLYLPTKQPWGSPKFRCCHHPCLHGRSRQCGCPVWALCLMRLGCNPLINGLVQHTFK